MTILYMICEESFVCQALLTQVASVEHSLDDDTTVHDIPNYSSDSNYTIEFSVCYQHDWADQFPVLHEEHPRAPKARISVGAYQQC